MLVRLIYISRYEIMTTVSIDLTEPSAASARVLVAQIIGLAGTRGIDQARLASRAGISAESLSRLKKAGGCRLETALALARAAGLRTLDLCGAPGPRVAASLSARKLSAGRRLPISGDELVAALRGGATRAGHRAHLYGFFEELPIAQVHDVVLDEGLDYARLLSLTNELGAEGETLDWLAEMAGDGVAEAA
jgi:hypothetical protein